MFKVIRIVILILVLLSVVSTLLVQRNVVRDWNGVLDIRIIPVIADGDVLTEQYVQSLSQSEFNGINEYLITQAKRYKVNLQSSFNVKLEEPTSNLPPVVPNHGSSKADLILWSLKLKWWLWKNELNDHHVSQIRLYVLYQNPNHSQPLPHSTGLRNGLVGLINARVEKRQRPLHPIIITHELLHIFGATDKYDIGSGKPHFPDGYAEPNKRNVYPQYFAEIMGRSIPINDTKFEVASRLSKTIIGEKTAEEIGWLGVKE